MKLLERDACLVPEAIGHRMVHGGAIFKDHIIVDEAAFAHLEEVQLVLLRKDEVKGDPGSLVAPGVTALSDRNAHPDPQIGKLAS